MALALPRWHLGGVKMLLIMAVLPPSWGSSFVLQKTQTSTVPLGSSAVLPRRRLLSMRSGDIDYSPGSSYVPASQISGGAGGGRFSAVRPVEKPFKGLVGDVRGKVGEYGSDFRDGVSLKALASVCFLFFGCLAPAVAFGSLCGVATQGAMGTVEMVLGTALSGMVYALTSGQPLTIIGSTGPVLAFIAVLYDLSVRWGLPFLPLYGWTGLWASGILGVCSILSISNVVGYLTRFTDEIFANLVRRGVHCSFLVAERWETSTQTTRCLRYLVTFLIYCCCTTAVLLPLFFYTFVSWGFGFPVPFLFACLASPQISFIFIYEAVSNLRRLFVNPAVPAAGALLSLVVAVGTFLGATSLKALRGKQLFPRKMRGLVADFAPTIAVGLGIWVAAATQGRYPEITLPTLQVPATAALTTTSGRSWGVGLMDMPVWGRWFAALPGLMASILLFFDQNITTRIVNSSSHKLKKTKGDHLDMAVLSLLTAFQSIVGMPWCVLSCAVII